MQVNAITHGMLPNIFLMQIVFFNICRDEVAKELRSALSHIKLTQEGVYVQASTLGSLEALLEFLRTSKIPVSLKFAHKTTWIYIHLDLDWSSGARELFSENVSHS